jgi:hypothetical protein
MGVGRESAPGCNPVLIENAQVAEAHVLGVIISVKREGIVGIKPPMGGMTALVGMPKPNHIKDPYVDSGARI